jgi:hypothetical protein
MLQAFVRFVLVLGAIGVTAANLLAEPPVKEGEGVVQSGPGTVTLTFSTTVGAFADPLSGALPLSGTSSFSGGIVVPAAPKPALTGTNNYSPNPAYNPPIPGLASPRPSEQENATYRFSSAGQIVADPSYAYYIATANSSAAGTANPPSDKYYYIVTEGAGLGDSVRRFPCTGNEMVLDAISQIQGLSQVSSTKIWVARPTAGKPDKSKILPVEWDATSRQGINATNHKLEPGDRVVIGEDELTTRSNLIGKKTAPLERLGGITSLTTSVFGTANLTPENAAMLKGLLEEDYFTDDPRMKKFVLDAIRLQEEASKAKAKKAAAEKKAER